MDQATIISYAVGYIAAVFCALLIYLPLLAGIGLLLVLVGTVSLLMLILKALTVGLYRFLAGELRTPTERLHGGPGGEGLAPG
jgi:hypothetical protein